ncbi:MAG: thioredoxin family protein [Helicobacteraceae bacterium]|jgi:thioredoxin 1|nr:thioredoxin family protein [Helicobacteraceae bacterium]
MKSFITLLIIFLTLSALADEPMLRETPYVYVKSSIGKGKPHFVEVGSESCHSCQIMGKLLYKVKKRYPNYNIAFVNVKKERQAAFDLKIRMIPTQLIFDQEGKEVYRHVGVLATDDLLALFKTYKFDEQ